MDNSLKNRYIYAVVRHLPAKMQADVERELDSLISEMYDERSGNSPPDEQTLKAVLTELGSPEEMALKYHGGERSALISGTYYLVYKRVLRLVLPIIAVVLAVTSTISIMFNNESIFDFAILFVSMTFMVDILHGIILTVVGVVQAFAIITVVFAVLDYFKINLSNKNFHDLPEIPEGRMRISPLGLICSIVVAISTTVLLVVFPSVMRMYIDSAWVTVFDTQVMRGLWLPILAWTILEIVAEIMKLVEGRYTMRLAAFTTIIAVLQVICAFAVFGSNRIFNPDFIYHSGRVAGNIEAPQWIFYTVRTSPNHIILAIILIVLAVETVEVIVKGFQSKR